MALVRDHEVSWGPCADVLAGRSAHGATGLAALVTEANVHGAQPVGALLALAARNDWPVERVKVGGIISGRARHGQPRTKART